MFFRLATILILHSCLPSKGQLLDSLLRTDTTFAVRTVLSDTAKFRLQILYTETTPKKSFFSKNTQQLKTHSFRNRPLEYFFPASLVKLPVSAMALEKVNELRTYGVSDYTPFAPLSDFQCQGKAEAKAVPLSTLDLIKKIFVYSDNAAFNYLYELCGQQYIFQRLQEMGYKEGRINEKIARCDGANNRTTGPVAFYSNQELIHTEGRQESALLPAMAVNAKMGKGYILNGKYVATPKDFSSSNFIPLQDLHTMLISLVFPDEVHKRQRFKLSEEQRKMLLNSMSTLPREYCPDSCNGTLFKDNHVKYLMGYKDSIPSSWKIYNKVGLAHGFISDCTYLVDEKQGVDFFLSAVLYVNQDGILNDGKYEYSTIGLPFLRRLGELIYQYEVQKKAQFH